MRKVIAAAIQMSVPDTPERSIEKAEGLVRKAAADGANVILLPELFENWYFCQERRYDSYRLAQPVEDNPAVKRFREVARELGAVIPVSRGTLPEALTNLGVPSRSSSITALPAISMYR